MSNFGERLREAFKGASNAEISRKMSLSEAAIKNYIDGRVPDADKLVTIKNLTNCNLDWLLTGKGEMIGTPRVPDFDELFETKIREIVRQELNKQKGAKTFIIGDEKEEQEKRAA